MKHKVIQDFHLMTEDKKITTLKTGTVIEDWVYKKGNTEIVVGKDAVENNPTFFEIFDWKAELVAFLKANKMPQPSVLAKKIQPFIQDQFITNATPTTTVVKSNDKELIGKIEAHTDTINGLQSQISKKDRIIKEKDIEIEELNQRLSKKDSNQSRDIEEKIKDIEFIEAQLKKKKERLDEYDFTLEERDKELKHREFALLTKETDLSNWEARINQSVIEVDSVIKRIEEANQVTPVIQQVQQVNRNWDGVYQGKH